MNSICAVKAVLRDEQPNATVEFIAWAGIQLPQELTKSFEAALAPIVIR